MTLILPNLLELLDRAADDAEALVAAVTNAVAGRVTRDGRIDRRALDEEQPIAHGLAGAAAYAQTRRQPSSWPAALAAEGRLAEAEALPAQLLAHEYLSQLAGGIPM